MLIDSHQHFWKLDNKFYHWLSPKQTVLYRDYCPEQLLPHLKDLQINKTILVQAADTVFETDMLLKIFEKYEFIAGVVGWIDLESEHFVDVYERLKKHRGFIGVRPMLQDLVDDDWILRPAVLKNIEQLVKDDFPIDLLIFPRHLPVIIQLLEWFPGLRAVINHIAKPDIGKELLQPYGDYIEKVASFPNVMCKLSGLITQSKQPFNISDIRRYVHHVIKVFGTDSVMFGSDWPVCLLAGSYQDVYNVLLEALPANLSYKEKEAIFAGNANKFYKLNLL
ncbi:amidohydrolase family protein [Neobacillus sp. M.A.Huq-85]